MCYLVRQQEAEAKAGPSAQPSGTEGFRSRWAGAGAIALIGGIALAGALVTTPSMAPQVPSAKDSGAPLPIAARSTQLPAGGGVQETSLQVDDGVPGTEVSKAGAGNCHHGL
jgi:hypothetical protein